jgi:hypothetical protein
MTLRATKLGVSDPRGLELRSSIDNYAVGCRSHGMASNHSVLAFHVDWQMIRALPWQLAMHAAHIATVTASTLVSLTWLPQGVCSAGVVAGST